MTRPLLSIIAWLISVTVISTSLAAPPQSTLNKGLEHAPAQAVTFTPPGEETIPDDEFGAMVHLGRNIFVNTQTYAKEYVGNGLNCANCHLNDGREANSAPLWGAMGVYPMYRKKDNKINTIQNRIQGCFKYSMNGKEPAADSKVMTALVTYGYWMAQGAPIGKPLPGRGYPKLEKSAQPPDYERGKNLFVENCAVCHGRNGEGTHDGKKYVFPPLWGKDSYNWGAGMHRINTAAEFIKANMPYGKGGSLSIQEAWDVALYINSQERPPDPRLEGDIKKLDQEHHDENCRYGDVVNGKILGMGLTEN